MRFPASHIFVIENILRQITPAAVFSWSNLPEIFNPQPSTPPNKTVIQLLQHSEPVL